MARGDKIPRSHGSNLSPGGSLRSGSSFWVLIRPALWRRKIFIVGEAGKHFSKKAKGRNFPSLKKRDQGRFRFGLVRPETETKSQEQTAFSKAGARRLTDIRHCGFLRLGHPPVTRRQLTAIRNGHRGVWVAAGRNQGLIKPVWPWEILVSPPQGRGLPVHGSRDRKSPCRPAEVPIPPGGERAMKSTSKPSFGPNARRNTSHPRRSSSINTAVSRACTPVVTRPVRSYTGISPGSTSGQALRGLTMRWRSEAVWMETVRMRKVSSR